MDALSETSAFEWRFPGEVAWDALLAQVEEQELEEGVVVVVAAVAVTSACALLVCLAVWAGENSKTSSRLWWTHPSRTSSLAKVLSLCPVLLPPSQLTFSVLLSGVVDFSSSRDRDLALARLDGASFQGVSVSLVPVGERGGAPAGGDRERAYRERSRSRSRSRGASYRSRSRDRGYY